MKFSSSSFSRSSLVATLKRVACFLANSKNEDKLLTVSSTPRIREAHEHVAVTFKPRSLLLEAFCLYAKLRDFSESLPCNVL
jgi:hypothetical protein